MNDAVSDDSEEADNHLSDLDDGSGCTEIWEHLSERRAAEADADDEAAAGD